MRVDDSNRWYDKYPDLKKSIEKLKKVDKHERDEVIQGIKDLIFNYDNELISNNAIEFPLECRRRWLVINSLQYVDEDLITDIIIYLNEIM
jgi:hypothetical protein